MVSPFVGNFHVVPIGYENELYLIGGVERKLLNDSDTRLEFCYKLNLETRVLEPIADFPHVIGGCTAFNYKNQIFIIGGFKGAPTNKNIYVYDKNNNKWNIYMYLKYETSFPIYRLDGNILTIFGSNINNTKDQWYIQKINLDSKSWLGFKYLTKSVASTNNSFIPYKTQQMIVYNNYFGTSDIKIIDLTNGHVNAIQFLTFKNIDALTTIINDEHYTYLFSGYDNGKSFKIKKEKILTEEKYYE